MYQKSYYVNKIKLTNKSEEIEYTQLANKNPYRL